MPSSSLGRRFDQVLGAIVSGKGPRRRRERVGRFLGVESLEARALLANIFPSGVISSTPDGSDTDYTIAVSNSSASNSGIGSFWFASVPGQDYLATNPISVTPPTGWTEQKTSSGSGDGYGIEFVSSNPAYDVQPGGSLDFWFTSADTPASVDGNSVFYPSTPVGTSTVYPGAAYSDGGHPFVVTEAPTLDSIVITPADPDVPDGETEQLTATGTFSNSSTENLTSQVTWSSTATSFATISNTSGSQGLATSVGQGPTTIIATLDGITASTVLTVGPVVLESIALATANPFVVIGNTDQFAATGTFSNNTTENLTSEVSWASGATSVATISNVSGTQGLATGVQKGSATISAALDGITGKAALLVTPVLESISIAPGDPSVPKGESEGFTATGTFADNSTENITNDVTWASANTAIATISNVAGSSGVASAMATGTSSISATVLGITGSTLVTVSPAVLESISVSPASPSIPADTTDEFTASGIYSDNSTQNVTSLVNWSSAVPSVATVSWAGVASGLAPGTSTISASYQGITGSAALAVSPPLVTLADVDPILKRDKVTQIVLTFTGSLEADLALDRGLYRLVIAGNRGSFAGSGATLVKVSKAEYSTVSYPDTVTLIPRTPFTLKRPVKLTINGLSPSGLEDSEGRLIDGNQDGQPGSNAVAVLSKNAFTIET
jgi:Bacterial Ig-like domain (group 2)